MKILHLTTDVPSDVNISGGSTRQFRLLASLAHQGHVITVASPVTFQQHLGEPVRALAEVGVRLIPAPRQASREEEVLHGLRHRPTLAFRAAVLPFYAVQTTLLAAGMAPAIAQGVALHPDVVTIENDTSVSLEETLPVNLPCVLTAQNVTASYYATRAESSRSMRRLGYSIEAWRSDRYITPRLSRFARLIAVSESDAALFRARTPTPVEVIPNGTSIGPPPPPAQGRPTVVFPGTMNHPPNREGIHWFHAQVWPQIRRAIPDAQLVVVGRHPPRDVLALGDSHVRVTGGVPDMAPFLSIATLVIAPLHAGGGTRLKILDAFAAERAVVATTIGAEGLQVEDGRHLLIADDPADFAAATICLLRDEGLRRKLATQGRQLVEARYDWAALGIRFGEVLTRVVEESRRSRSGR